MAHQCLKCGHTYPDGSPQILRGCETCKGTRFFYTEAPVGADERQAMAESTEVDLERLALGKGTQARSTIPTKGELPLGSDADWVKLGPGYLRNLVEDVVKRSQSKKPVFRTGLDPHKSLAEWVRENGGEAAIEDAPTDAPAEPLEIVDLFASAPAAVEPAPARTATKVPASSTRTTEGPEEVVYKRAVSKVPAPLGLDGTDAAADETLKAEARRRLEELQKELAPAAKAAPPPEAPERTLYPEGVPPETVAIKGEGQYELDVKRLLEKSPIVVHKDGTYSLHLPSLMESVGKTRR